MIQLRPYSEDDLPLLIAQNSPEMTVYLGGPETDEKLRSRHEKYVKLFSSETEHMFVIWIDGGARVGSIGYWDKLWRDETVYETGWGILPEFQGRGIATEAARVIIARARAERKHRSIHAFPRMEHPASNAICRKAGFTLIGDCDFEYPKGNPIRCNDWYVAFD
jgi:RimJ/RimL family protein N-acetyltransferase